MQIEMACGIAGRKTFLDLNLATLHFHETIAFEKEVHAFANKFETTDSKTETTTRQNDAIVNRSFVWMSHFCFG